MAKSVCFYFQVHQPFRIKDISLLDESDHDIFVGPNGFDNQAIFEKVSQKCYLPMTDLLLNMLEKNPEFKVAFSCSGVFLDQCEHFGKTGKQVLDNFKKLAKTGQVEFLTETYFHSLAFLHSKLEFAQQVQLHQKKIKKLFGQTPKIFRNTELIYSDELGEFVRQMGFEGVIAEGWDPVLGNNNPNCVQNANSIEISKEDSEIAKKYAFKNFVGKRKKISRSLKILTKNYKLSDDIAFRFGNKGWESYPLMSDTFAQWVADSPGDTVNLFMDFETFGEHQWEDTGIFHFFEALPQALKEKNIGFKTPTETLQDYKAPEVYTVSEFLSWADEHRDLSAWLENDLQKKTLTCLHEMEQKLHPYREEKNKKAQAVWYDFRRLQTSDHLYYMSTKYFADGDVHTYFSPFKSPYEAFIYYMNVIERFKNQTNEKLEADVF